KARGNYSPAAWHPPVEAGETSTTFQVSSLYDRRITGNRTVNLPLSSPTGGATLGTPTAATLTITDSATKHQRFVADLYLNLLQRPAEPTGLAGWTAMLDAGVPRAVVVQGIENSGEHLGILIDGLYGKIRGRPADPAGRQAGAEQLQ